MTDFETWPVHPEGVEGVLTFRMPDDYEPGPTICARCGTEILEVNCFGVPNVGIFHSCCWTEGPVDA